MARPLRYEAPGGIYHVIARGDGGKMVFDTKDDREVLAAVADQVRPKRRKGSVAGAGARAHDEAEAERIASRCLTALGLSATPSDLEGRGRWLIERALTAGMVRKHTGASLAWVAQRLAMGHPSSVSRAQGRVRESKQPRAS